MLHPDPSMSIALFAAVWDARSAALGLVARALAPAEPPTCEACDAPLGAYVEERDTDGKMIKVCLRCAEPADCPDGAFIYAPGRAWVD